MFLALEHTLRYDEALAHAERMRQKFPEYVPADASLARIKLWRNQDIDAYLDFGRRAGSSIDPPEISLLLIARFVRGDIDGALTLLQVAEQSTTPREAA